MVGLTSVVVWGRRWRGLIAKEKEFGAADDLLIVWYLHLSKPIKLHFKWAFLIQCELYLDENISRLHDW